ncbi:MAG: glycosyltransferase family 39 protein, partial [Anaerolineae bacterium]|nr:glycosyltransferase family 39 protein [Anaerolineae bacterium]
LDKNKTVVKENIAVGFFLFLVAFLPRAFGLDVFITPDEYLWIERSGEFLAALLKADWAATFQVGHPGLTTRWTGVLGILATYLPRLQTASGQWLIDGQPFQDLLADMSAHLPEVLAATRYPTVILTSMGVVGLYFLLRSLFGQRAALLSAVILALDPFYLALSRVIHHDALSTTFMALSLLSFMVHLRGYRPFLYLVLSGLMVGLAFLSKSPSLFLVPFTALLSVGAYWAQKGSLWPLDWRRVAELGRDWVIWGFIAALVFAFLWPAMWVQPLETIQGVIDKASGYAASPHERGNFFLGKVGLDPGPLFYPVALLFRLTPLTLLGLGGSVLLLLGLSSEAYRNLRRIPNPPRADLRRWHVVQQRPELVEGMSSLWAFILLYVLFMTTGAKKFDRYLLPIFPVIDILAALGLLALGGVIWEWACPEPFDFAQDKPCRRVKGRFDLVSRIARFRISALGLGLVLLLQAGFALPHYPYYLTYYNPLLGGIRQAAETLLVGWGEGYEQAVRYLNQKDDAAHLKVATWYAKQCIGPFFGGQVYKLNVSGQEPIGVVPWYDTDYVVSYINQVQREIPNPATVSFFRSQQPDYVVHIKGLDYASVYKVPQKVPHEAYPYEHVSMVDFGQQVRLLGWEVEGELAELEGLNYLVITMYWQSLQPITENYRVYLKLVDGDGQVWREDDSNPIFGFFLTSQWEEGVILRDKHGLEVPPDAPPGVYYLGLDLFDPELGKGLKPAVDGDLLLGPIRIDERRRVSSG